MDSSYSAEEDDCNFISFMASKTFKKPSIIISKARSFDEEDEDEYDELLGTYNELLSEHIKSEKESTKGSREP